MLQHGAFIHNVLLALTVALLLLHLRAHMQLKVQVHPNGLRRDSRRVGLRVRLVRSDAFADEMSVQTRGGASAALQNFRVARRTHAAVLHQERRPSVAAALTAEGLPPSSATVPPTEAATRGATKAKVKALRPLAERVKGRGRLVYVNNGCNNAWRRAMGYTGECVQHDALLRAFKKVRVNYVELPEEDWRTQALMCGQFKTDDVSIVLTAGCHDCARKYAQKPCLSNARVMMLDWFGTAAEHVPPGVTMVTAMMPPPHDTHSKYLGYALQSPYHEAPPQPGMINRIVRAEHKVAATLRRMVHKKEHGVMLGKNREYWAKKRSMIAALVAHGVELHCIKCGISGVTEYRRTLPKSEYAALLSGARFVLGSGDPIGSPSPLEAIQDGTVVIIPRFATPLEKMGRKHLTQHDDFARIVEQQPAVKPFVCTFAESSVEELIECVDAALALPKHASTIELDAFTQRTFEERVEDIFKDALL